MACKMLIADSCLRRGSGRQVSFCIVLYAVICSAKRLSELICAHWNNNLYVSRLRGIYCRILCGNSTTFGGINSTTSRRGVGI